MADLEAGKKTRSARLSRAVMNADNRNNTSPMPTTNTTTNQLLSEGVDFSEGGWATDTAAALVGLLYLITSATTTDYRDDEFRHFTFLFGGTFIAHLFGGLAHRYFPNRASDGTGQIGFYICMMIGYCGNCLRYGFGWGILKVMADEYDPMLSLPAWVALANMVYLILAGLHVIWKMMKTHQVTDDAVESLSFRPDILFGLGETFTAVMENVVPLVFLWIHRDSLAEEGWIFGIAAVVVNLVGWAAVYLSAFLYLTVKLEYNPNLMQRIFHYCMIAMLWAVDMFVRTRTMAQDEK
jgi:hypothetical protein